MAGRTAILSVRITGDGRDAEKALRKTADAATKFSGKFEKLTMQATTFGAKWASVAAVAGGAIGSIGIGLLGVAAIAGPALAAVALGMDGIKQAAGSAAPQFDALKQAMSSTFATEMVPGFQKLGGILTAIQPQMVGLASSISGVFNGVADAASKSTPQLQAMVTGASQFVTALGPGLNQLTTGFLQFGANASASAGQVGTAFGSILSSVGTALAGLDMNAIMAGFSSALTGLGQFIGPLITLLGQLAAVIGPVLGQAFAALGPVITQITPSLTQIAQVIGQALIVAINALAPVIPPIVSAIASILSAVAPIIPPLAQLAALIGGAIAQAMQAVSPLIAKLANLFSGVLGAAMPIVAAGLNVLVNVLTTVANAVSTVVGWIQSLVNWLSNIHWPSPPAWLSDLFGAAAVPELIGVPRADSIFRFLPPVPFIASAAMPEITAADPGAALSGIGRLSGTGTVNHTTITVQIDGALDPLAVGRQVEDVLRKYGRATGGTVAFQLGGVS